MNMRKVFIPVMSLLAALFAANVQFAAAQEAAVPTCQDLEFAQQVLDVLPEANSACLGVIEQNGKLYAEFKAEIVRVSGGEVRAKLIRADGSLTEIHGFRPESDARVSIGGRSYRYNQLSRGQQLNVYMPPDRFEVAIADDDDHKTPYVEMITVVVLYRPEPESATMAALPATAGLLPLIGLVGGLLTALGGGMVLIRRKLSN
jgi:hypothetical protein